MASNQYQQHREEERNNLIKSIKASAMTVYENAESIVGNDHLIGATVTIEIAPDELTTVHITRAILPDWQ